MSQPTYYHVLQVDCGASRDVIETAYRRLAQLYYPDLNRSADAARKMQAINEAYQILRDPVTRFQYDGTLKWRDPQPMYLESQKPLPGTYSRGPINKAWLAYQRRVNGGYVIKIGRATDFDELVKTLKSRVPSSSRRYNSDNKDWFVSDTYADVLAELFYDFQPESIDIEALEWLHYEDANPLHAHYQSTQPEPASAPSTGTTRSPKQELSWFWIIALAVGVIAWWNWPTGTTPVISGIDQRSIPPAPIVESEQSERVDAEIAPEVPTSLECPHVITTASAQAEPRLSAEILYTVPVNECLDILPVGREISGVPWYELGDGTWLRATFVENQPHWEFEQGAPVITREPEQAEPLAITISNANVRNGPCLNHSILRTLPQGTPLSIVGYSRDATHVWYALDGGGWVREDVVRDAPTVPEVSGPECSSPPTPTPTGGCPGGCITYPTFCAPPIKGNISFNTGEKIYHMPGQQFYESTAISPANGERWFCTETEARAAGWRKSYR